MYVCMYVYAPVNIYIYMSIGYIHMNIKCLHMIHMHIQMCIYI